MIRRPPRSTLFPTRRSSDLDNGFMYVIDGWGGLYKIDARAPNKGEFVWANDFGVRHEGFTPLSRAEVVSQTNSPLLGDRKSTRLNSSHQIISYSVFCLKQKN